MKEDLLHYLWKFGLYTEPLITTTGDLVEVISTGLHNTDSGPDFFNARLKIGETLWAGNVELHVNASDWNKHNHQQNEAYDNVVLHVVAKNDFQVCRNNGEHIPTLELKAPKNLYEHYLYLMQNNNWVPCESFITKIDEFTILQCMEALLVERLKEKSEIIAIRLQANNYNWEETFYQTLAYNFGFKTNAQPFEMLSKSVTLIQLGKHKDQLPLLEAMLFGQAGLIDSDLDDSYMQQLYTDYKHLAAKFNLKPLNPSIWKFMRLRPANFPTIRIAQFAALVHQSNALFSKLLKANFIDEIKELFEVQASDYWDTHYSFKSASEKAPKRLGLSSFYNIVINTISPVLFYYGEYKKQPEYREKAMEYLFKIPAERNAILNNWANLGLKAQNAFDSQALIQLKNVYCNKRNCLACRIGNQVIKQVV